MVDNWVERVRRAWYRYLPLVGLVAVFIFIAAVFAYPLLTDELAAVGTVALTYGLVYLYYQQKSILATEHEPDIILEGVKEIETDNEERRLLALALSNVGKGQATNLKVEIESELNSQRIPKEKSAKRLNRHDKDLEGWFQRSGIADYLDAGERKKLFILELTKELMYGTRLGGMIAIAATHLDESSWDRLDALDADRLFLKMTIYYEDTLGRSHSDLVLDYVGPFEKGITISEFLQRGFQRESYEQLKELLEDDFVDGTHSEDFDPIDVTDDKPLEYLDEKVADDFGEK